MIVAVHTCSGTAEKARTAAVSQPYASAYSTFCARDAKATTRGEARRYDGFKRRVRALGLH